MSPEEIRLFGAVMLSEPEPWEKGMLFFTHWAARSIRPEEFGADLTTPAAIARLEAAVSELMAEASSSEWIPTLAGPYSIGVGTGSFEEAQRLLEAIDVEDQLLLAGLGRMLQGARLAVGPNGAEDMALPLFVAMGAAFELLRLQLSEASGKDQPMGAVYEYLRSTFPEGDRVVEFFEEMYDYRILAVHPASRLGEFWANPMMVCDVYSLRESLVGLYRHLLTDAVGPSE